jgi:PPM family protein phosphatase
MTLAYAVLTDVGLVRKHNEDRYIADVELGLFAVVDGMGGHAAGDVAAQAIADAVHAFVRATRSDPEKTWPFAFDPLLSQAANRLQVAIRTANRQLAELVKTQEHLGGAGATICGILIESGSVAISNVGDCRVYLVRGGEVSQVTKDHSFVAEQVESGMIALEDARRHPLRHLVTRAVSGHASIEVDTWDVTTQPGDRLLLCSDGVHGLIPEDELAGIISSGDRPLETMCAQLIDAAKAHGGTDNCTAVVVEVR